MELDREIEQTQDTHDYIREVTARYIGPRRKSVAIQRPEDAAGFMRNLLRDDAREHFLALFLDAANQVASFSLVSLGCANSAPVHPREVFQPAILAGASGVIVGHNHPSGVLHVSPEDTAVTKRLREAGTILGIPILDHVLFSRAAYLSFKEQGLLA
jgi:DNA repair protein RadC